MEVITLGTGSPLPDPHRAGPCTLVRAGTARLLVDCGRGALMRAMAVGCGPAAVSALLLTHLHSDHVTDVNDLVTMRWVMTFEPTPLLVVGPPGTRRFVEATLDALADDVRWRLEHHADLTWEPPVEVVEVVDGPVDVGVPGVRVSCAPTAHAPVHPTVGYRVEADGDPAAVVLAGDTVPCEGLDRLCRDADLLVHTVVRRSAIEGLPIPRLVDVLDYHSDVADAAATATRGGVGTLVLTHMVPAPPPEDAAEAEWAEEARTAGFDGRIVVARDLTAVAT